MSEVHQSIDYRHLAEAFAPDTLRLTILPTEQCNFRCVYCYEDFSVGQMRPEIVAGLKALVSNRASSLSALRLSWFGGEPTAAIDVVYEVMKHATAEAKSHDFILTGDMTTNAYRLDRDMLDRLCELSVTQFQITLDGPETIHDRTRVLANGQGTFQRIWKNLTQAKASSLPFKITLRLHLSPENSSVMGNFVDELREAFLDDERFSLFFKAVGHWGGPNDTAFAVMNGEAEKSLIQDLTQRVSGDKSVSSEGFHEDDVCYAAKPNNFIIRADGRIEKCTVALNNPANLVGTLHSDGTLTFSNKSHQNWLRGWETMNGTILGCPLSVATKLYVSQQ